MVSDICAILENPVRPRLHTEGYGQISPETHPSPHHKTLVIPPLLKLRCTSDGLGNNLGANISVLQTTPSDIPSPVPVPDLNATHTRMVSNVTKHK